MSIPTTIGIVVDTYKCKAFKEALKKAGFKFQSADLIVHGKEISKQKILKVYTTRDRVDELQRLCKITSINIKRAN